MSANRLGDALLTAGKLVFSAGFIAVSNIPHRAGLMPSLRYNLDTLHPHLSVARHVNP